MSKLIKNKNSLFKQVDNSSLDQMNYNLWNSSTFDPDYPIRSLFNDDDSILVESIIGHDDVKDDKVSKLISRSKLEQNHLPTSSSSSINLNDTKKDSKSNSMIVNKCWTAGEVTINNTGHNEQKHQQYDDQLCTLYLDMTFDDRIFFGVHNFFLLKYSLSATQCNLDFSAPNNKVSIMGPMPNVYQMCESFFKHSTLVMQFELFVYDDDLFQDYMKKGPFESFRKDCEKWDVYVSYRLSDNKSRTVVFNFLTFRQRSEYIIPMVMDDFKMRLEFYQLGKVSSKITCTMQIPIMIRRDSNNNNHGLNNAYIEAIEKETKTQIQTKRCNDFQNQYPFENVIINGWNIFSVLTARSFITARFEYELKFQIPAEDTGLLVKIISNMQYDKSSIDITISPCQINCLNMKIISIKTNEYNKQKIFHLRQELLNKIKSSKLSSTTLSTTNISSNFFQKN